VVRTYASDRQEPHELWKTRVILKEANKERATIHFIESVLETRKGSGKTLLIAAPQLSRMYVAK